MLDDLLSSYRIQLDVDTIIDNIHSTIDIIESRYDEIGDTNVIDQLCQDLDKVMEYRGTLPVEVEETFKGSKGRGKGGARRRGTRNLSTEDILANAIRKLRAI